MAEPETHASRNTCLIYNPTAGRGRARQFLKKLRREFPEGCDLRPTTGPGHAEALAFEAARAGFAVVAAAGGDGTVHEVANGLLRSGLDVAFRVVPVGSANDYAHSLTRESSKSRRVDVGLACREDGRERYFVNGMGLGFNGAVTRESRQIKRLRGIPLYSLALLRAMWYHFVAPMMTVTLDGQPRRVPTLALTVNLGRREGNFIMAPDARLDDGWFDYLQAGELSRWQLVRYVPRLVTGRLPTDDPLIWTGRCRQVRVESDRPLTVHLDGEFFCQPEERMQRIEVEILPGRLLVHA